MKPRKPTLEQQLMLLLDKTAADDRAIGHDTAERRLGRLRIVTDILKANRKALA